MGKRFDKEFKIEAVRLASEPGNTQSEIERDLGISQGIISRWKRELRKDGDQAFPGKGRLKPDDDEMRRLKRENERLRQERDILKNGLRTLDPPMISETLLTPGGEAESLLVCSTR